MEKVGQSRKIRGYTALLLIMSVIFLAACKSVMYKVPPVAASSNQVVVWHDLLSPDALRSRQFMEGVLGWKTKTGNTYSTLYGRRGQVVGGIFDTQAMDWNLRAGGWLLSMSTSDLDATLKKILDKGGRLLQPAQDIPDRGHSALVADPQGAVFNLVELSPSQESGESVDSDTWIWYELITAQPAVAAAWYANVFQLEVVDLDGGRKLLKKDGVDIATVSVNSFEDSRNQWLAVVAVNDFENTVVNVSREGGRVALVLPSPAGNGKLALVQDPTGAALILQEQEVSP